MKSLLNVRYALVNNINNYRLYLLSVLLFIIMIYIYIYMHVYPLCHIILINKVP